MEWFNFRNGEINCKLEKLFEGSLSTPELSSDGQLLKDNEVFGHH